MAGDVVSDVGSDGCGVVSRLCSSVRVHLLPRLFALAQLLELEGKPFVLVLPLPQLLMPSLRRLSLLPLPPMPRLRLPLQLRRRPLQPFT